MASTASALCVTLSVAMSRSTKSTTRYATDDQVRDAMWRGDDRFLDERSGCECCCREHTFRDCPARRWHGCLGQSTRSPSELRAEAEAWAASYARVRGMSREEFFGAGLDPNRGHCDRYQEAVSS